MAGHWAHGTTAIWLPILCGLLVACAEIQPKRYGINKLNVEGAKEMDPAALKACLATVERERKELGLAALREPECGVPPFDEPRFSFRPFAWGWTDWPIYDEAIFRLDMDRISRWYRARGFYDARVKDVKFDPPAAGKRDENDHCKDGCKLEITLVLDEGKPILVRKVELLGIDQLNKDLQEDLHDALILKKDAVFDESVYDEAKNQLEKELREAGHARAKVTGEVVLARAERAADIKMSVVPGPIARIGKVRVESVDPVPTGPVLNMAMLKPGQFFRESDLDDAQRSVYSLGSFSSVNVRPDLDTESADVIDVVIEVEQRRKSVVQVGAGIMSGVLATGAASGNPISVPQWDVHLLGSYEHRNFFGGLRKFRIEDRPRMLFLAPFPDVPGNKPRFGNLINIAFAQPGVFEPRTTLFIEARADYGPDPFQLFFRNDLGLGVGLERGFSKQRIKLRGAIHQEAMYVTTKSRQAILKEEVKQQEEKNTERITDSSMCRESYEDSTVNNQGQPRCFRTLDELLPSSYRLPFLEQVVTLDFRDNAASATKGGYFSLWDPLESTCRHASLSIL